MKIRVGARSHLDVPFLNVEGVFFPTKGTRDIEVTDQDESPPQVSTTHANPATGLPWVVTRPDQDTIGRLVYQKLVADGRFTVIQLDTVDASITRAEVGAARAEVARVAGLHADMTVENAGLSTALAKKANELEAAEMRILELEDEVEKLKKAVAAAATMPAPAVTTTPVVEATPPADTKPAGKGNKPKDAAT